MQRHERIVVAARGRELLVPRPGNEITDCHGFLLRCMREGSAAALARAALRRRPSTGRQAAFFCSICDGDPPLPIWIRRGFMASGTSLTKSTISKPSRKEASFTWT